VQVQLIWTDLTTGEQRQPVLETPIAIGRDFAQMPAEIDGKRVSRIVLDNTQVADYHALIDVSNHDLVIIDQNTSTGTLINGVRLPSSTLVENDRLQIGAYELQLKTRISVASNPEGQWECDRMIGFLFPHRCGRTSRLGCSYCDTNEQNNDPYFYEHSYYTGYGRYERGYWGSDYYYERDRYTYNPETGDVDFTEGDNISLEREGDEDFEMDMGAS